MAFSSILSVFGLRSLPTDSATTGVNANPVDDFVHVPKIDITEPVTQESPDGLLVIAAEDTPASKMEKAKAAIACCVQVFLSSMPTASTHWRSFLREGFGTLHDCANTLQHDNEVDVTSMVAKHEYVLRCLNVIKPYWKRALCNVFSVLLGDIVSDHHEFEIPPTVWVLRLGPVPLAAALSDGKKVCEILLAAEDEWVAKIINEPCYDEKKAALLKFAEDVAVWRDSVKNMTADGEA